MEWDDLTYVEMGDVHYGGVPFEADMTIKNGNVNEAQKVKAKVNRLMYACISGGDRSPAMMELIKKYFQLDTLLFKFILRGVRREFEALSPDN